MAVGHYTAIGLNTAGVFEGNLPPAPAHIMHVGIDNDDFVRDDGQLVRTIVPLVLSIGAGEAVFAAAEGATLATTLLRGIKVIRVVNAAATPAKIDPPVLIASIVVSILVEYLARKGIEAWQWSNIKGRVVSAANILDFGTSQDDDITAYRGADTLVAAAMNLASFVNEPIMDAQNEFLGKLNDAQTRYGEASDAYLAAVNTATSELSSKIREAMDDQDQAGDADFTARLQEARGLLNTATQGTTT
jgi:hypothetical protein